MKTYEIIQTQAVICRIAEVIRLLPLDEFIQATGRTNDIRILAEGLQRVAEKRNQIRAASARVVLRILSA